MLKYFSSKNVLSLIAGHVNSIIEGAISMHLAPIRLDFHTCTHKVQDMKHLVYSAMS